MQCAGRQPGRVAHLFEPEPATQRFEELEVIGGPSEELIAFVGRWDMSRERTGKTQPAAGTRGGRPASESKCANCCKAGHTAAGCKGYRIEQSARTCFDCNKPWHQARNCSNNTKGVQARLLENSDDEVILCFSVPRWRHHRGRYRAGHGESIQGAREYGEEGEEARAGEVRLKASGSGKGKAPSAGVCLLISINSACDWCLYCTCSRHYC